MQKKLEIIGFNIESCITAQAAGAHRIELCDSPAEGGTTPSAALIKMARKILEIELYVMIRPRGGDFLYSPLEFELMKEDIMLCKQAGCDGVVLGILNKTGEVDKTRCAELIKLAYPMEVTFHRAFDRVKDPFEALQDVIELGCERILTSGLKPKAIDAVDLLAQLVKKSSAQIIIMPGSGVNSNNLAEIAEKTGAHEFHSSASTILPSQMEYINDALSEQLNHTGVNEKEVRKMAELISNF